MTPSFIILSLLLVGSALASMLLRKLIHSVLCLALSFASLAALFLGLGAEFAGFVQILVYVGAVAIVLVFAVLLTQGDQIHGRGIIAARHWLMGAVIAAMVGAILIAAVLRSSAIQKAVAPPKTATVNQIGIELMSRYILPLEAMGLLLTAALMGAVVIALPNSPKPRREANEISKDTAMR